MIKTRILLDLLEEIVSLGKQWGDGRGEITDEMNGHGNYMSRKQIECAELAVVR